MPLTKEDSCYTSAGKYCACVEFHLDEDHRHGFHTSQLIDYTLEPNPDAEDDKNAPPQKFALAFSTADVVILGWRLGILADKLRENDLATVHVLPKLSSCGTNRPAFCGFEPATRIGITRICLFNTLSKSL